VILTTLSLLAVGAVMVQSALASVAEPGAWYARSDVRHLMFAAGAVAVLLIASRIDYRVLAGRKRWPVIAAGMLAVSLVCGVLVFVPGIGRSVGGYHRWIRVGPTQYGIGFQPSELIKISLLVFLAAWLSRPGVKVRSFRRVFVPAVALIAVSVGLIITQDFGTAAVIGVSSVAMLALAGVPWLYLLSLIPPAAGGFYLLVVQSPHRWSRMTAMLDVWSPDNPCTYQPRQSLLAILTGGWFGKGIGCGTVKLGFLPEDSTDFVFSALCEEWGFIGAAVLIGLWLAWTWTTWHSAGRARDRFGQLLAGSIGFVIVLQAIMHIAVDTVALPPTGMSMPFVSAGGTSLLLMAAATGLIVSVSARGRAPAMVTES
jgi:cell division protein FtsW